MTRRERYTAAFSRQISMMSVQRFLAVIGGLLVLVTAVSGFVRWAHNAANNIATRSEVDSLFVRQTTFTIYQQGLELQHQRDSLIADARAVRSESKLDALVADCRRRGGCQ